MTKFETFLKEINDLERKYEVHLGDFFHFEDGPDEFEIWEGKRKERFSISSDYGHYVVVSRSFDTDAGDELEGNSDAGDELEGNSDAGDELEGNSDAGAWLEEEIVSGKNRKTKLEIELPTNFVNFMDAVLSESDCPWKSRSEFIEDCTEYFIRGVFEKANTLMSLMVQKRWPRPKDGAELEGDPDAGAELKENPDAGDEP